MKEKIEKLAEQLYHADGYTIAVGNPSTSWNRDRENVRERYRKLARDKLDEDK